MKDPAIITAAIIPIRTPIIVVFPFASPKGFDTSNTPIIHDIMLIMSYLVSLSPIAMKAKIEVKIGDVNDKVVAMDSGFT